MFKRILAILVCIIMVMPAVVYGEVELRPANLEAPQNLTVELKEYQDGKPYFQLSWINPQGILELIKYWDNNGEAPLGYQIDMKVGIGKWNSEIIGNTITGNSLHAGYDETGNYAVNEAPCDPINVGELDIIDIKSNVYQFRVQYSYEFTDDDGDYNTYSPFSSIASIGIGSFYKDASSWAIAELDKAVQYGFITDKIKDNMKADITREEFCEVVVRLYEKLTGNTASYSNNPFSDTTNPEILKAAELGIVKGVGGDRFAPNNLVTRQEISVMLFRAVKLCNPDMVYDVSDVAKFKDEAQIASWALEAVRFMFKNGIMKGDGTGNVIPKGNTTRQEAVLLVVRTYEKYLE